VKLFLMDNAIVMGVGEAPFYAGIDLRRRSGAPPPVLKQGCVRLPIVSFWKQTDFELRASQAAIWA